MRTKWQLGKDYCACHLRVRGGVEPGAVVAWSWSCNGQRLLSMAPEIARLGPAFWRGATKSTKQPKNPTHRDEQRPALAVGRLQPPAQSPASPLRYREIFLTGFFFFFSTKICLSSCSSLLNYETLWQAKAMPEEALGAGWRGMLPLQTKVSTPAAQAQEPGWAAGSSAMWTWICHVGVRRTKTLPRTCSAQTARCRLKNAATAGFRAQKGSFIHERVPSPELENILLFPEESLCVFQTNNWNEFISITSGFHSLKPWKAAFLLD